MFCAGRETSPPAAGIAQFGPGVFTLIVNLQGIRKGSHRDRLQTHAKCHPC